MYLLDTNICIYIMKNRFPRLTEHLLSMDPEQVAISSITLFELEYGAAKSNWGTKTRENLYAFLSPFSILPFDSRDAAYAGNLGGTNGIAGFSDRALRHTNCLTGTGESFDSGYSQCE